MNTIPVIIGMPTMQSTEYIHYSLKRVVAEIMRISEQYSVTLVACLNGSDDNNEAVLRAALDEHPDISSECIVLQSPGKNEAVNAIGAYGKTHGFKILHLIDDDVFFSEGALSINLDALVGDEKKPAEAVLVGSTFKARIYSFSHFLESDISVVTAFKKKLWHNIFRIPFDAHTEPWGFCSAQSLALYIKDLPILPPSDAGFTDDTYINYNILRRGTTIKPTGSELYFNVATSYGDWFYQQTRILYGVKKGLETHSGPDQRIIFNGIKWPYTARRHMFCLPRRMGVKRLCYYGVYMGMIALIENRTHRYFKKGIVPAWGRVESTKIKG
ncbi:MAG: hypothetical protein OCD01_17850 [Fibrobacterales bacterium]